MQTMWNIAQCSHRFRCTTCHTGLSLSTNSCVPLFEMLNSLKKKCTAFCELGNLYLRQLLHKCREDLRAKTTKLHRGVLNKPGHSSVALIASAELRKLQDLGRATSLFSPPQLFFFKISPCPLRASCKLELPKMTGTFTWTLHESQLATGGTSKCLQDVLARIQTSPSGQSSDEPPDTETGKKPKTLRLGL